MLKAYRERVKLLKLGIDGKTIEKLSINPNTLKIIDGTKVDDRYGGKEHLLFIYVGIILI